MVDDPGFVYAMMLMMGDTREEYAGSSTPIVHTFRGLEPLDSLWGAGMLNMRLFTPEGEDAPSRMRLCKVTLEEGEQYFCRLNPDDNEVNQPLPAAVDHFRAAAYWMEEDLDPGANKSALIDFAHRYYGPPPIVHTDSISNLDHKKQFWRSWPGSTYTNESIRVRADDVPRSAWDPAAPADPRREVYIAIYWEDQARDDTNGPNICLDRVCP